MLEGILNVFRALLAPVIAGVVAYIAYQQHKTSRDKLKLDLYEKRFRIFYSLMHLLGLIVQKGDITDDELNQFLRATTEADFLFDKEISNCLDTIYRKGVDIHYKEKSINSLLPPGEKRNKVIEERGQLFEWFTKQFEVSKEKFSRYLSFRQSANDSEKRSMNCKSGFKRMAWVLSVGMFIFWVGLDIYLLLTEGWDSDFWILFAFGVLSFIAIWVVYYVGLYIVKGFCDGRPIDEQKQ